VAGHDEVRIVHGHGTGKLKAAVRRFLDHRQSRNDRGEPSAPAVRARLHRGRRERAEMNGGRPHCDSLPLGRGA
jgi:hypothetical protein